MSKEEDIRELVDMIKNLPKEERLQIKGAVIGMRLAHEPYIDGLKTGALQAKDVVEN